MLLFAYGSHACPYGDWSKEEKLTYVGGLFSCSLQVNFSSHLSLIIHEYDIYSQKTLSFPQFLS